MSATLLKALVASVPMATVFWWSIALFSKRKTVASSVLMLGAGCLVLVILTHVAEALRWLPWMHWGEEHSVGHYLDLSSAVLGLVMLPLGFVLHALHRG
jgi:hypothetical protein